jgi:hypothetical protein
MLYDIDTGGKDVVIKKEVDIKEKVTLIHLFMSFLLYFCIKIYAKAKI